MFINGDEEDEFGGAHAEDASDNLWVKDKERVWPDCVMRAWVFKEFCFSGMNKDTVFARRVTNTYAIHVMKRNISGHGSKHAMTAKGCCSRKPRDLRPSLGRTARILPELLP